MHLRHNLLKTILCLALSSCMPTTVEVVDNDPLKLFVSVESGYTILNIEPNGAATTVTLRFTGADVRYNEPRCRVQGLQAICTLGDLSEAYKMPFRGQMNDVAVSYYRNDGSLHTKTIKQP